MAFDWSSLLSGAGSIAGGIGSLFGDDGSDAIKKALRQADDAQTAASRRNLALYDPQYQTAMRAQQAYLQELGLPYITDDPALSFLQHNTDSYIAVGPDGVARPASTLPSFGGASSGGNSTLASLFGGSGPSSVPSGAPSGWNPKAAKGTPIGTYNGVTYYQRDEDSLMPYNWAAGTGKPRGPDLSAGAYQKSPGYDFQVGQGIQALDRSAAANGRLNSGRQAMELARFGQGVANQDYYGWADREQRNYDSWLNRVGGMAGQAPQATAQVANNYSNQATNSANLAQTRGTTMADLANRSQSAFNGGMSNIFSGFGSLSSLLG